MDASVVDPDQLVSVDPCPDSETWVEFKKAKLGCKKNWWNMG